MSKELGGLVKNAPVCEREGVELFVRNNTNRPVEINRDDQANPDAAKMIHVVLKDVANVYSN